MNRAFLQKHIIIHQQQLLTFATTFPQTTYCYEGAAVG